MADMSDPLVVSDAPLLDPADTHLAHTASVVVSPRPAPPMRPRPTTITD